MQKLQKQLHRRRASSGCRSTPPRPGKQGNYHARRGERADARRRARAPTAVLLDPDGTVGRAYGAKTTPHMYVIDEQGVAALRGRDRQHRLDRPGRHPARDQLRRGRDRRRARREAGRARDDAVVRLLGQVLADRGPVRSRDGAARPARREGDRQPLGAVDAERRLPGRVGPTVGQPRRARQRRERLLQLGARERGAEADGGRRGRTRGAASRRSAPGRSRRAAG